MPTQLHKSSSANSIRYPGIPSVLSMLILLLFSFSCMPSSESLVVPQELPSILSLIYSNIPPIKKGTDSRLGFGFRLGEHADFQILLELGPQKETQPIGDQDSKSSFNKRQTSRQEQKKLLLLRQQLKELRQQQQVEQQQKTSTYSSPSSWLQSWSEDMKPIDVKKPTRSEPAETLKYNEDRFVLPPMPAMSEQAFKQLQALYKMAATTDSATTITPTTTTDTTATITTIKPPLSASLNLVPPKRFNARPEDLQMGNWSQTQKTKDEITKDLMDVSLDDEV